MPAPKCQGGIVEFPMTGSDFVVTDEVKEVYDRDGFILVRGLLDKEEVALIDRAVMENELVMKYAFEMADGQGRLARLSLWNHPGNDLTGMLARCEKVAGTCEKLLGGESYHYHTKLSMKDAKTGGQFVWHQDYGYWYKNGNLRPDLITAYMAIDPCVKENGCLQVIKGTHHYGRLDHIRPDGQQGADLERVEAIKKREELIYAELQPGDCLFFHCNILHASGNNDSDMRRWAILCCYNRADNDPIYDHHHPRYTPLHKVPNSAIKECTNFVDSDPAGKWYMDPATDKTTNHTMVEGNIQ